MNHLALASVLIACISATVGSDRGAILNMSAALVYAVLYVGQQRREETR